uniref:Expressed protein n=1 Tax=Echinococcus granulosus TaxID=6210 RepID=A0A068WZ13_ECHGR|nr:expressed protein [Echinococcus granulosus]
MDLRLFAGYTLFPHQSNYLTPFPFSLFFFACYVEHMMSFASFHATYAYSFLVPSCLTDYDYLIVIAPGLLSSLPTTLVLFLTPVLWSCLSTCRREEIIKHCIV